MKEKKKLRKEPVQNPQGLVDLYLWGIVRPGLKNCAPKQTKRNYKGKIWPVQDLCR